MKTEKPNTKAEDTLNSLEGIRKVLPDEFLFQRIMTEVSYAEESVTERKVIFGYAAVLAVIVIINLYSVFGHDRFSVKSNSAESAELQTSTDDYYFQDETYNYR